MNRPYNVYISPAVRKALEEMCKQDFRQPIDQIRYCIAAEAKRRALLPEQEAQTNEADLIPA